MSSGTPSHGTLLKVGDGADPEIFTTIGIVGDISGIGYSRSSHEVADQASAVLRVLPGVARPGPVSAGLTLDNGSAEHAQLRSDSADGTVRSYRVEFPADVAAPPIPGPIFEARCFVESLTWDAPNDGVVTGALVLQPTGAWVEL